MIVWEGGDIMEIGSFVEAVRVQSPRVHCITNYVTAADCANLLLAGGARPVMADDPAEVAEITAQSHALVVNLGTPNERVLLSQRIAGKAAMAAGIPVVFDPVGVFASSLRREAAERFLAEVRPSVIRGNSAEMEVIREILRGLSGGRELSQPVLVTTGEVDTVTDDERCFSVRNGRPEMAKVTGTGCQLSALIGAYVASSPKDVAKASAAAVAVMGVAGELAWERMARTDGNATYGRRIIDAVYTMTAAEATARAKITETKGGEAYEVREIAVSALRRDGWFSGRARNNL